jgi:hypothetical protein
MTEKPGSNRLAVALVVGSGVAIALGVYGRVHDPTQHALFTLFFTNTIRMKAWLATVVVVLAVVQILSALRLYGKIKVPRRAPSWLGDFHRLMGTLAFIVSIPVAFHCLWSLGFKSDLGNARTVIHSVLGCAFYGAIATKVIVVRSPKLPDRVLPVVGGTVFAILVGLWLSSSLWFFRTVGTGI